MSTPSTLQSRLVPFTLSVDGVTYKNVVCKKAWNFNGDTTVNKEESDCGTHTALGANNWTFDFEILLNTNIAATEYSVEDVLGFWKDQVLLYVKVQYPTSGSIGANLYIQGQAYITNLKITNTVGSLMSATGTLSGDGDIDNTP